MAILGDKEYYKGIGEIKFEGKESDNPLAFKYYNPDQIVAGKTMRDHFKFAIAYWHTFCGQGGDPFGPGTQNFPWDQSPDPIQAAKDKADAAFEFISKMGFDYFCFHDYDLIQEGATFAESEQRLDTITNYLKEKQAKSGIKLLWGTANCFSNPRYMNGAATNPEFNVVARAGGQIKLALFCMRMNTMIVTLLRVLYMMVFALFFKYHYGLSYFLNIIMVYHISNLSHKRV